MASFLTPGGMSRRTFLQVSAAGVVTATALGGIGRGRRKKQGLGGSAQVSGPEAAADSAQGRGVQTGEPFVPYRLTAVFPARWGLLFLAILIPAFDFWNWGKEPRLIAGLPSWVWTSAVLGVLLSVAFALFFRSRSRLAL